MDANAIKKLHLQARSEQELHDVYDRFLSKWERKARWLHN